LDFLWDYGGAVVGADHPLFNLLKTDIYVMYIYIYTHSKAIPLWAWTRPEGSRRLRLPDFKTIDT
jgi:hypothetical protein